MLNWMKRYGSAAHDRRDVPPKAPKPQARAMSGRYLLLYRYLEDRYADNVVLTFAEIEDLLGFALPDQARLHDTWWTDPLAKAPESNHSDSWTLASRTAVPNLRAQTVAFERSA